MGTGNLVSRMGCRECRATASMVVRNFHLLPLREEMFLVLQNILQASWGARGANFASVPICA